MLASALDQSQDKTFVVSHPPNHIINKPVASEDILNHYQAIVHPVHVETHQVIDGCR